MKTQIFLALALLLLCFSFQSAEARSINFSQKTAHMSPVNRGPTWKELFDNFLEGVKLDELIDNTTNCVHYVEDGYGDVSEAIGHFIQRGWTWENYLDFLGSLGNMTPITRTCFDVVVESRENLVEYIAEFEGFVDFAGQAWNNAVYNSFTWFSIGTDIWTAIQNNRPREIAFNVGVAVRTFFDFKPKLNAEINVAREVVGLPDLRFLEEFLKGFLEGSQVFSSDNISNCVNQTEFVVASIEDANKEFGKRTEDGFRNGVFELADVFEVLKPLNADCLAGGTDIRNTFISIYKTFQSPLDIVLNAARHFTEISAAALGLYQDFKNGQWHGVGKELGTIFFHVFVTK